MLKTVMFYGLFLVAGVLIGAWLYTNLSDENMLIVYLTLSILVVVWSAVILMRLRNT